MQKQGMTWAGGAVLAHTRVGEPMYFPIAVGLPVWLGLWLRDPRLRDLLPIRRAAA